MKIKIPFLLISVFFLLTFGCNKEEEMQSIEKKIVSFEFNEYNNDLNDFAQAVNQAINSNTEFRNLIKQEALKKFDGDYDVLLTHIINRNIADVSSNRSNFTVKELLNDFLPNKNPSNMRSSESPLETLSKKYPDLQVSVPVKAEEWESEAYIPNVTFIPLEYQDGVTKSVLGYDNNNNIIEIDANNEPENAVIVIGPNERLPILDEGPIVIVNVPDPINLTALSTEAGIRLNWTMNGTTNSENTSGYFIFRQGVNDNNFIKIRTIYGANNRSFNDNNIANGASYIYYVQAFYNSSFVSNPSNYINATAPFRPNPVVAFDAIQKSKTEIELRWQSSNDQFIEKTTLYRRIIGTNSSYVKLGDFTINDQDYLDMNFPIGKQIDYKIVHQTSLGVSDAKYDFVKTPYRDISTPSKVYIKKITIANNLNDIEGWLKGAPEFYFKVLNADRPTNTPYEIQPQIDIDFDKRGSTSQDLAVYVMDWSPGYWYDMITITGEEYDKPSVTYSFNASASYKNKDKVDKQLDLNSTASVKFEFEDKGELLSNVYLNYYDNPDTWLNFPNFGVSILLSDKP